MSFFVTGTDTAVGKTFVSCLLLETLRGEGVDAVGYKPVSSGGREDAEALAAASGGLELDAVNPIHFEAALAPRVAAMLEGGSCGLERMLEGYRALADRHRVVLVEGAGGWETPLAEGLAISDLALALGLPVILVAANRLGALNHILLSVAAIRGRGLECAGVVLNQLEDEMDTAMITNKGLVEELAGVPLIEHVIHRQDFFDLAALERWL